MTMGERIRRPGVRVPSSAPQKITSEHQVSALFLRKAHTLVHTNKTAPNLPEIPICKLVHFTLFYCYIFVHLFLQNLLTL